MNKKTLLILSTLMLVSCSTKGSIHEIDYNQLQDKINNNETFIYYLGKENCNECNKLVKNIKNSQSLFYYIDIKKLSNEEYSNCVNDLLEVVDTDYFIDNNYIYYQQSIYTPSLLKVVDGIIVSGYVNSLSKENCEEYSNTTLNKLFFYSNFIRLINKIDNFDIYFYNSSKEDDLSKINIIKKELEELRVKAYLLDYSKISISDKEDLIDKYNSQKETSISSLDQIEIFKLSY